MALVVDGLAASEPEVVAGRYRIDARIANGGMGAVYRAFDRVQQRDIALKRLRIEGDARRRTRMFEREFHTLAGLRHPRIIEVYDYGIDERGAYYTMELLDGRDLRDLAPLPYKDACFYLRDVASSLALVHARGLLHRDLSPRNVRITSNGRAKLIDFGALSGFGRKQTLVGTAPLVPPEALYGGELDPRADLYALGALAYWVLTGRHAYDVRSVDQLPTAWEAQLFPPSDLLPTQALLPALPPELDQLIMALLSQNPLARPTSAGEVIARLSSIAELVPDEEPLSVLSYLRGGRPIGRVRERALLRKRLKQALGGHGSVVEIEAEAGMEVSRILADLAIEARLSGVAAVVIDASMYRGAYAVTDELARGVLAAQPDKAREAARPHESELARFIAESRVSTQRMTATVAADRTSTDPRESRMRTQAALLAWLDELAAQVPLLIAVHNFEHADDNSVALLAALARGVHARRMLIVLGGDRDRPDPISVARASLHESALRMRLRGLDRDEVRALVEASFGPVQNSERLAAWLHRVTAGKPQSCLDLMQHLVEHGAIRFIEGVWALPQEFRPEDFPSDIGQALALRFDRLSEPAQRLASSISLYRGPMPLERCLAWAALEGIGDPRAALAELGSHGVVLEADDNVRFSHAALREGAERRLSDTARQRLHAQLGSLLSQQRPSDPEAKLDAGWHLLHGGEEVRGAEMLAEAGVELSIYADGLPAAIPALRAALEAMRRQKRSKRELARLLAVLASSGFFSDRVVIETYGDEAASTMQDVLGLSLARKLSRICGDWLGTRLGLGFGLLRVVLRDGPKQGVRAFRELVQLYVQLVLALTGLGTVTLDGPRAQRAASLLKPLQLLGPDHAAGVIAELAHALAFLPEDRVVPTIRRLRKIVARLDAPVPIREMTEDARVLVLGTTLYALGALEGLRESPEVLVLADRLDSMGKKLFELLANQIRASYHALRGESALWELYRKRVEVFAIQAGSGWQAELWAPTSEILACYRARDLVGIRRVMSQLERLSKNIPSLRRHAELAFATYHMMRGEHALSVGVGAGVLNGSAPRSFIGWSAGVGGLMRDLIGIGDPARARELGLSALALLDAEDRTVSTMVTSIVVELASAEAALGEVQPALARIEAYLTELGDRAGGTTRGILYEASARIAKDAGDMTLARRHLAEVDHCFRPSENPALIARIERLRRELDSSGFGALASDSRDTLDLGLPGVEDVRSLVRRHEGPQKRHDSVLELLLEHTGGPGGYLFGFEDSELRVLSPRGVDLPPRELNDRVQRAAETWIQLRSSEKTDTMQDSALPTLVEASEDRYRTYVLGCEMKRGPAVLAVVAIAHGRRPLRAPSPALLAALAEALAEPASTSTQPPADQHGADTEASTNDR